MRWINVEPAIQSEVNQKETYYCARARAHTHTHMEIYKNGTDIPTCRTGTLRHKHVDTAGEG